MSRGRHLFITVLFALPLLVVLIAMARNRGAIEVAAVVVWRVRETAQASFDVEAGKRYELRFGPGDLRLLPPMKRPEVLPER